MDEDAKPSVPLPVFAVGIACLLGLLCFSGSHLNSVSSTSSPTSTPFTLPQFAEKSSIVARYVNGISIGQSLFNGNLDKMKLIDELFPLGPNMKLDSLGTSNVFGLTKDLGSIQTVVDKECSGNDRCEILDSDLAAMKTIESFKKHVSAVETAKTATNGNEFEKITQLNNLVSGMKNVKDDDVTGALIKGLTAFANSTRDNDYKMYGPIEENLKKLRTLHDALKTGAALIDEVDNNVLPTLEKNLNSIFPLVKVTSELQSHSPAVQALKNNLNVYEGKYTKLAPLVSRDNIQSMKSKLDVITNLMSSKAKKELTAGFINGFDDFMSASTIDSDKWLKGLLNSGMDLNETSPKLSQLKPLAQTLGSLSTSFKSAKKLVDSQSSNMAVTMENVGVISSLFDTVRRYGSCVQKGSFYAPLMLGDESQMKNWLKSSNGELKKLKPLIETFMSSHQNSLNAVSSLATAIENTFNTRTPLDPTHLSKVDEMVQELSKFGSELSSINVENVRSWLQMSSVKDIKPVTQNWIKDTGLIDIMECVGKEDFGGDFQNLNNAIKSLSTLKTGNKDVESITKLVESLDSLVAEWNKVRPALSSKSKRAAQFEWEDAQKVSKDFGDINSITQKLNIILKTENDITTLINGRKIIEQAIEGVKDQTEKDRLKTMWSDGNLAALQNNLKVAKALSAEVGKINSIENVTSFKTPFEKASEVQESTLDFNSLAFSLNGKVSDQNVASSLSSLKSLNLEFSKFEKTRVGSVIGSLEKYFDSVFGSTKKAMECDEDCTTEKVATEKKFSGWGIALIIFAVIVVSCAVFAAIFHKKIGAFFSNVLEKMGCKKKKEKKKTEPKFIEVTVTPDGEEVLEATRPKKLKPKGLVSLKGKGKQKLDEGKKKDVTVENGNVKRGPKRQRKGEKLKSAEKNKEKENDDCDHMETDEGYNPAEYRKELEEKRIPEKEIEKELKRKEREIQDNANLLYVNDDLADQNFNIPDCHRQCLNYRPLSPVRDETFDTRNLDNFQNADTKPSKNKSFLLGKETYTDYEEDSFKERDEKIGEPHVPLNIPDDDEENLNTAADISTKTQSSSTKTCPQRTITEENTANEKTKEENREQGGSEVNDVVFFGNSDFMKNLEETSVEEEYYHDYPSGVPAIESSSKNGEANSDEEEEEEIAAIVDEHSLLLPMSKEANSDEKEEEIVVIVDEHSL